MDMAPLAQSNQNARLLRDAIDACRAIPPAWPLHSMVATNPFLGQSHLTLAETSDLIGRLAGVDLFPPRAWFHQKISEGLITRDDLAIALQRIPVPGISEPEELARLAGEVRQQSLPIDDMATIAARASGTDWSSIVNGRIGAFAAGYFDEGQALWRAPRRRGLYDAWRLFAMHDLTPEIAGLKGFAAEVTDLPMSAPEAIEAMAGRLGLGGQPRHYFHGLLLRLGGFASHARHLQFVAERDGGSDGTILELLAICLVFEAALLKHYGGAVSSAWESALSIWRESRVPDRARLVDAVLQEAAEQAASRLRLASFRPDALAASLAGSSTSAPPAIRAVFCIDVRSEPFRCALETANSSIATSGFAGFFGMGVSHAASGSDVREHRLPVLLPAGRFSCEDVSDNTDARSRLGARARRAFGRFRTAAVSSLAFVEAMGGIYAGKLVRDTLGAKGRSARSGRPVLSETLPLEDRVRTAEAVLRNLSMTEQFSRLTVFIGHGASTVNNPYNSALQCGACGGHAGDVNARLLASLLNESSVRAGLLEAGINIPDDTLFLAGLHDTTTDHVELFVEDADTSGHGAELEMLRTALVSAGRLAGTERAERLPRGREVSSGARSRDWAETRPEWGLAGCTEFIIAPRSMTAGDNLAGRAFLHDYSWHRDRDFRVLEMILTAPVIVASWINLQYFGSTVAPSVFGSGNKLLHNVVGGIGVLEGNGGLMRTGLPWQSVHDGHSFVHEPLRLSVYVAAPASAIIGILAAHEGLRTLADSGWIKLFCLENAGGVARRYAGSLRFDDGVHP